MHLVNYLSTMNSWSNYLHDHTIRWHMWRRQKVGLRFWPATIEHIFIQHNVIAGDRQERLSTCCCCCSVVTRFFTKSFWEDFHPMLEPELEPTTTECRTNCWVDYRCDYWVQVDTCGVHGGVPKLALSDEMSDSKLSPQKLREAQNSHCYSENNSVWAKLFIHLQNLWICEQVSAIPAENLRAHRRAQSTAPETLSGQIN